MICFYFFIYLSYITCSIQNDYAKTLNQYILATLYKEIMLITLISIQSFGFSYSCPPSLPVLYHLSMELELVSALKTENTCWLNIWCYLPSMVLVLTQSQKYGAPSEDETHNSVAMDNSPSFNNHYTMPRYPVIKYLML